MTENERMKYICNMQHNPDKNLFDEERVKIYLVATDVLKIEFDNQQNFFVSSHWELDQQNWRIWLSITRTREQQYVGYKVYWDGLTRTRGDFYTGTVANNRKGIEDIIH